MQPRVIGRYRRSDGAVVKCDVAAESRKRAAAEREGHERVAVSRQAADKQRGRSEDDGSGLAGRRQTVLMS